MMKKIIQICSMLVLAAAFLVVSTQAQTRARIDSTVPFSFQLGEKTYKAGNYIVKISTDSANAVSVTLEDTKGNELQTLPIFDTGEAASGKARLVFGMQGNQQILSKIIADDKTFSLTRGASN